MRSKQAPVTRVTSRDLSHMKIFGITPKPCRSLGYGHSAYQGVRVLKYENNANQIKVPWDIPPK